MARIKTTGSVLNLEKYKLSKYYGLLGCGGVKYARKFKNKNYDKSYQKVQKYYTGYTYLRPFKEDCPHEILIILP